MIQYVDIVVNPLSIAKSKKDLITGEIFFQVGNELFPGENWSDFIIVVLNWWLLALKRFHELKDTCFELTFMDGPFLVKGIRKSDELIELSFIKRYTNCEEIMFSSDCSNTILEKSLLSAARRVIREIEVRKWENTNIVTLKNNVNYFKTKS